MRWGLVFIVTGILFCLTALFTFNNEQTIDIQVHDTYFVISSNVFYFPGICSILIGLFYILLRNFLLNKVLSFLHFIGLVFSLLLIYVPFLFNGMAKSPRTYYEIKNASYFDDLNLIVNIGLCLLIISQLFFILNIVLSVKRNKVNNIKS